MAASVGARPLRAVLRERVRSSKKLYDACYELVRHGDIASAIPALVELTRKSPHSSDARQLLAICKQLRRSRLLEETVTVPRLLRDLHRVDRNELDTMAQPHSVLVRPVENAKETLIVFVTSGTVLWVSLSLFHHHLRRFPVNLVYVQSEFGLFHMTGLNGLGADYRTSLAGLHRLVEQLDARSTYCVGGSSSGYAALRFALDLQVDGVMSFSGLTSLDQKQLSPGKRHIVDQLMAAAPEMAIDLAPLYRSAEVRPRTILCYGAANRWDPRHANRLAGIDGVRPYPIDGYADHDTLAYFLINQKFDCMFDLLRGSSP